MRNTLSVQRYGTPLNSKTKQNNLIKADINYIITDDEQTEASFEFSSLFKTDLFFGSLPMFPIKGQT